MKKSLLLLLFLILINFNCFGQKIVEISSEGMSFVEDKSNHNYQKDMITKADCFVLLENMGDNQLIFTIKQNNKIINTITVKSRKQNKIKLLNGQEFNIRSENKTHARINFEKII